MGKWCLNFAQDSHSEKKNQKKQLVYFKGSIKGRFMSWERRSWLVPEETLSVYLEMTEKTRSRQDNKRNKALMSHSVV